MSGGDDNATREPGPGEPDLDELLAEVGADVPAAPDPVAAGPAPLTPPATAEAAAPVAAPRTPPRPVDPVDDPADDPVDDPVLPHTEAANPIPITATPVSGTTPGAATWYRTDEDRNRSVYRRANPWYRRVARGVIGLAFVGAAAVGLYFGAQELQDWIERDRLPATGAEAPDIRATTFQVDSSTPAPTVDGTLTLDATTGAFEFVGRAGGDQAGVQVVSPDGVTMFVRRGAGAWQAARSDPVATDVRLVARYVADDETADAILTSRLRRGYADLQEQTTEGVDENQLTRYEMELDTRDFSLDYPVQWQQFRSNAVPGTPEAPALPAAIWIDEDDVLARVRIGAPGDEFWSWQRLAYSDQAFVPIDPTDDVAPVTFGSLECAAPNGGEFATDLATCDEAIALGRERAVAAGLASEDDTDTADDEFTTACRAIQNTEAVRTTLLPESVALAAELDEAGICPGDLTRLTASGS